MKANVPATNTVGEQVSGLIERRGRLGVMRRMDISRCRALRLPGALSGALLTMLVVSGCTATPNNYNPAFQGAMQHFETLENMSKEERRERRELMREYGKGVKTYRVETPDGTEIIRVREY